MGLGVTPGGGTGGPARLLLLGGLVPFGEGGKCSLRLDLDNNIGRGESVGLQ